MSSCAKNNTRASILLHLRSPNIRVGYLLNDDHFPYEPFLLLYYILLMTASLFLPVQPRRSAREAIRTWRENYRSDMVYCSVANVLTVQFSLTRFRARNDCCCHLVKLLKFKYLTLKSPN